MPEASRVGFLIAGVQKGGTTALFDYLQEQPRLSLAPCKEVHFFDDEVVNWSDPDYSRYHGAFTPEDGRLRGEATPIYIYWPQSLERIARYNPAMRIVLLFRDPVERAWSQWKMEFARGFEREPFAWAIREGRRRVANDPVTPGRHRVFSYVERGFYGAQLQHLYTLFAPEQVLLLRSEDLLRSPDETVRRVCGFLGIDEPKAPVRRRRLNVAADRNYGAELRPEDVLYLRQLYAADLALFRRLSGLSSDLWRPAAP